MSEIKQKILKHFTGLEAVEINKLLDKVYAKGVTEGRRREKSKLRQDAVIKSVCPKCKSDDWDSVGKNCRCNKCNERWKQTVL